MPFGNGTGPTGAGPMTGRGMGSCVVNLADAGAPAFAGRGGWGRGLGRGGGRGWRHVFRATGLTGWQRAAMGRAAPAGAAPDESREQELSRLRTQAADMQAVLEEMRRRIDQLQPPDPAAGGQE